MVKSTGAGASAVLAVLLVSSGRSQKPATFQSLDLVDVDVVVSDRDGHAVSGLTRDDFEVREDGKRVDVKTFVAVAADGVTDDDAARSIVILLDDVGMPPATTSSVRAIAGYVATQAGPIDELSVLRFNNRSDEPYGDFRLALARISEYQAGAAPFDPLRSAEDVLKLVANVARRLEPAGRRRKAIVCIGSQRVCNVEEPLRFAPGSLRRDWVDAVAAAARANLSVYAVMATRGSTPGGGLVDATGGEAFGSRSDLRPAIDRIWEDASHHYLLGYWPATSSKELHSIDVKVARKGVHVLARRQRGN
jgi:VWFA-related protein